MIAAVPRPGAPRWRVARSESADVAVAERDALGTTARLVVWPGAALPRAAGSVDDELARMDLAASRFRTDSEISMVHSSAGGPVTVSPALAEAVGIALAAAAWTDGLVDPTVGAALIGLGYDRDFVEVGRRQLAGPPAAPAAAPGWRCVLLAGRCLQVPAGVRLDLGATAKGLAADRAVRAVLAAGRVRGALVSLGGDLAVAGDPPRRGWPVLVADGDRPPGRAGPRPSAAQLVRIARGGLATSSITTRQWRRSGRVLHHIVDPRTGQPADGPWRTVSVAAATCAAANAAATAAIVSGADAPGWLASRGVQARLVGKDGAEVRVGGWPAGDDRQLTPPVTCWLTAAGGPR